jgi:hypothetical protein
MRITVEHTIWCDRCQYWEQQPTNTKALFVKQMRRYGWKISAGRTVCPDCVLEIKNGREWEDIGYRRSST